MLKNSASYLGTFPHDLAKSIPSNKNSSQIINLHHSHQSGSHFVCIYNSIKSPFVFYFDSYGMMPSNIIQELIRKTGKKILYNRKTIQSQKSNRCGTYCYMFIKMMEKKVPFLDFINIFSSKEPLGNDKILLELLN